MHTPRHRRTVPFPAVLAVLAALALVAVPRELLSMRPPDGLRASGAPATDFPFPRLAIDDPPSAPPSPGHAVRLPVTPDRVRLAVDKKALHPMDHPLPVRRSGRIPGQAGADRRLQVFAVNEPSPAWPSVQEEAPRTAPSVSSPRGLAQAASRTLSGLRLLVVGDSLSISLADVLERRLAKAPGLAFSRLGKVSSGLARPEFFDWEAGMEAMARKARPDVVVVMIGANDNKSLRLASGKVAHFGSPGWAAEYRRRAARLVEIARTHNPAARVVWLGAPVMADPGLARDMPLVNAALSEAMRRLPGCRFVDVWLVLAGPGGRFAEFRDAATRLRTPDGVHLAPAGAALLADACLAVLAESANGVMLSQLP